jgi:hypothetical protein
MVPTTLKEINKVPVSFDELRQLMAAQNDAVERGESFDPHIALVKMFPGDPGKATAIIIRMTAFAKLNVEDFKGFGFEVKSGGFEMVNEAAIRAAAECPLQGEGESYPVFNAAEFHQLCLKHANAEGTS